MIAYHQILVPDPDQGNDLDRFLARGWYRMHQTIFTTTHVFNDEFFRVHWLRFDLTEIKDHKSHKKIRRRNQSFRFNIEESTNVPEEHEELYARYRQSIDFNGASSIGSCLFGDKGIDHGIFNTYRISVFDRNQLIAGGYFDVGKKAGTSILHFFDPAYSAYSLGKYLILLTIDFLRDNEYDTYYPGYLVAGDSKMDYKLFLGKESAQYFAPQSATWVYFNDEILEREELTQIEQLELLIAFRQ